MSFFIKKETCGEKVEMTKEDMEELLKELLHNYGIMFHYLDSCRPASDEERRENFLNMETLALLLKGPKFYEFFIRNCPDEYSYNHIGEKAHSSSELGARIEKSGVMFIRNDII